MKNSKKGYLFAIILCIKGLVFSQENKYEKLSFSMYTDYVSKIYNINCKIPENFTDLKYMEFLKIRKDDYRMGVYCPVIQSNDKECILMYDLLLQYNVLVRNLIKSEIRWMQSLNCCDCLNTDTTNIEYYATIISGSYAKNMFNADSVIFMDIPLESAYKDTYTYCTSMFIIKKEHASMILKWFFTEAGNKDKDKYIKGLSKSIWYIDGAWTYDSEKRYAPVRDFLNSEIPENRP
ncbi:MAG: hypothetical protein PHQ11_06240 [Paludibacter sp.]|nr:hypothetical protein [Paludibacter sp.]MDD4199357.1 hypothetical protein [Paludibacter sp.]MDD4427808.1 hypothetical protein [Paludibacter sp.]